MCLHTHRKCFEETVQIIILSELYHISRKSNFASCFLSVHGKMTYNNWTATEKNCLRHLVTTKAQISLRICQVSSATLLSAFWKSYLDSLRANLQFSCKPVNTVLLKGSIQEIVWYVFEDREYAFYTFLVISL